MQIRTNAWDLLLRSKRICQAQLLLPYMDRLTGLRLLRARSADGNNTNTGGVGAVCVNACTSTCVASIDDSNSMVSMAQKQGTVRVTGSPWTSVSRFSLQPKTSNNNIFSVLLGVTLARP